MMRIVKKKYDRDEKRENVCTNRKTLSEQVTQLLNIKMHALLQKSDRLQNWSVTLLQNEFVGVIKHRQCAWSYVIVRNKDPWGYMLTLTCALKWCLRV
jgi:hypothetical protein